MVLEILFLTAFLLNHLLNYLHPLILGGPKSCVLPSLWRRELISPSLGFFTTKTLSPGFLYAWSLPNMGWVSWILYNPSCKRNLWEKKDYKTEEKREECTVYAKDMVLSLSASCFDHLDWSLAHQIYKTHPGQRCWRTFRNEPGTQGSKLLLPLLGWNHFWIHPFFFLEWSFKIPGGFMDIFFSNFKIFILYWGITN